MPQKPNVLVIDSWPPAPDRDSASLRMVNLLTILSEMACRLTFGAGDPPEWRHYGSDPFCSESIQVLQGHAATEAHLEQQRANHDIVILSRLATAARYIRLVRRTAPRAAVVFDTTDLHHLRGFRGAKVTGNRSMMIRALRAKRDELALVGASDCTLVVSPVEKEMLKDECPGARIHVVSNIHTGTGSAKPFGDRSGILFVGAFAHHPNEDGMAYYLGEIDPLLEKELPDVPVTIIGSDPPDWLLQAQSRRLSVPGYVPDISPHFDNSRLSIAPLRYGAGVKGKVLLSLGYGVPVVGSAVAVEGIPAELGRDIMIADTADAFCQSIVTLYRDETRWNRLSENGLEIIRKHFSFDAARQALARVFADLGF